METSIEVGYSDFSELIQESSFLGTLPFEAILEGINEQFCDYINLKDRTNYVAEFFRQMESSQDAIEASSDEESLDDFRQALDVKYRSFIGTIQFLFKSRLTITLDMIEQGNIYLEEVQPTVQKLYVYFILGARDNFKIVLSKDLLHQFNNKEVSMQMLESKLDDYSPLLKTITPEQFLVMRGEYEVQSMFADNVFCGNFLRKYTPKLYQNTDLCAEIIQYTSTISKFKTELELATVIE